MSTLKVTTIQDTSAGNSSTTEEIYNGRLKAWVNFNGTGTVAIRDDYNVNSIGDDATGRYQVFFGTAQPDADYVVAGNCVGATNGGQFFVAGSNDSTKTSSTTSFYITSIWTGGQTDVNNISVMVAR